MRNAAPSWAAVGAADAMKRPSDKTVSTATPPFGAAVTFTVTVTNNGPDTAAAVSVIDALPPGLTLVSATPAPGTYVGGLWTVGSVASGDSAVYRWLTEDLEEPLAKALGMAMNHILQVHGPAVVETRYGRALKDGLYEFRLDENLTELLQKLGRKVKKDLEKAPGSVLLRVFFHPHGDKLILLLGGYNKAERTSKSYQQSQIALARKRLADWKRRQAQVPKSAIQEEPPSED